MSRVQRRQRFDLWLAMKKLALSGFVILSFLAYVIDQQLSNNKQAASAPDAAQGFAQANQPQPGQSFSQPQTTQPPNPVLGAAPAQAPAPLVLGQYRDGTYNGKVADAYYGPLQVQAVIQGGKLVKVQVLESPSDRRTSRFINSQALPWLQSEAIQAQSANVDFISGATLTSDAFVKSLGSALSSAKSGA